MVSQFAKVGILIFLLQLGIFIIMLVGHNFKIKEFKSYESIGVVAQIVPWNFPLLMLSWKIAPALAMGNAIVFKAAEQTPITAMYFAHLCKQAGVPSGVINMVNGDGIVGASLGCS